jgi:hypothetical protein
MLQESIAKQSTKTNETSPTYNKYAILLKQRDEELARLQREWAINFECQKIVDIRKKQDHDLEKIEAKKKDQESSNHLINIMQVQKENFDSECQLKKTNIRCTVTSSGETEYYRLDEGKSRRNVRTIRETTGERRQN